MSLCRGCGKQIIWGVMGEKKIPLDPTPPIYKVVGLNGEDPIVRRDYDAMVSHFTTCPDANRFSNSKPVNLSK